MPKLERTGLRSILLLESLGFEQPLCELASFFLRKRQCAWIARLKCSKGGFRDATSGTISISAANMAGNLSDLVWSHIYGVEDRIIAVMDLIGELCLLLQVVATSRGFVLVAKAPCKL